MTRTKTSFTTLFATAILSLLCGHAHAQLASNLVSYWSLDEASGNAIDAHGANDLTDTNTVGSAAGKVGNCRDFEKDANEYFSIADNAGLRTGDIDFSFAAWVKMESKNSFPQILSKWGGSGDAEYALGYESGSDRLSFSVSSTGSNTVTAVANTLGSPSTGTWYFVAGGHNATTNEIWISVNAGTPNTTSHSAGVAVGAAPFLIGELGGFVGLAGGEWDGLIDELGFWKRDIRSDLSELYNAGSGRDYDYIINGPSFAAGTLSLVSKANTSITGSWTAATDGVGTVTNQLQIDDGGGWDDVTGATSSPGTATGLTDATEYDLRVAYIDDNETVYSNTVTVTTEADPTLVATQITLVAQGTTTATLCAHPVGGIKSDSATYQWYRSTTQGFTPGGGNIISGATSRTISETGLTSNTLYYYVLRATKWGVTVDYPEFDVLTRGAAVGLPVVDDTSGTNGVNNTLAGTVTWNHTCSGTNRGLFVSLHQVVDPGVPVTATYGGVSLVPFAWRAYGGGVFNILFKLVNPPLGEHAIVVNWGHVEGGYQPVFSAISVKDWDTIAQHGQITISPSSTGDPVSLTLSDYEAGDLALGIATAGANLLEGAGMALAIEQASESSGAYTSIVTATQAGLSWTGTGGGGWVVVGMSLSPVGSGGTRPVPAIERFEERMVGGADGQAAGAITAYDNWQLNEDPNEDEVTDVWGENGDYTFYYAGTKVLYDIGDYLGVTTYDEGATKQLYVRDRAYEQPTGYFIGGKTWEIFTDSATVDHANTSDANDLVIVEGLRDTPPYAADGQTALESTALSRENAYHLMSHLNGDILGIAARTTKKNELIANAKSHMVQWFTTRTWVGVDEQFSPFMVGLTAEALIRHHAVTNDPEVLPLIKAACDYLWDDAWDPETLGMLYQLNDDASPEQGGPRYTSGSPVLNNLIAKMYAWVAVQTGDQAQMDRAEWLFAGSAINGAYLYGKQFNQAHWLTLGSTGTLAMREEFYEPEAGPLPSTNTGDRMRKLLRPFCPPVFPRRRRRKTETDTATAA